ncbi:YaeQ family protein [Endozoicomonadaceae bacterium StTr2]
MALKATIYKTELQIADMDRGYYQDHNLTIAQHPSENDLRMMIRIVAFIRHAHEHLTFTKGLSTDDEPDLWQKSLSDEIEVWIDLGQPDEKRIRKACGRAKEVFIYTYSGNAGDIWWEQNAGKLARFSNLKVYDINSNDSAQLASLVNRTMSLQCTVQDGAIWLTDNEQTVQVNISPR